MFIYTRWLKKFHQTQCNFSTTVSHFLYLNFLICMRDPATIMIFLTNYFNSDTTEEEDEWQQ